MNNLRITIAIDGFSSCGKSTMAKDLAHDLGYTYIDTGAMYRAVTLYSIRQRMWQPDGSLEVERLRKEMPGIEIGFETNPSDGLPHTLLNEEDVEQQIRTMEVSAKVSPVATLDFVRSALVRMQQEMGHGGGIVMDGRDIGTTVFPDAELKIFVTARPEIRAKRRYDELRSKGDVDTSLESVLSNLTERDYIDSHREVSPLRQAPDAVVFDNSEHTIETQRQELLRIAQERIKQTTNR